ncbi:MAG: hypothetical protein ACLTBU_03410 [Zhenhengia sp.]|uniref:Uncharacterized protein n=1 Tax=Zhenhengia yiwuensis TaxID=2763666 RepID=A0A926ECZ8_9FIRM|nr:hypothetical protein [Zhenhengia yiwuensis]MBC8578711.1 hypothetical protein [Zhenhengia yiwuensis]MBP3910964.1 hypothetical protein [Niameybacter sp.]MDU6360938.1 hypothetical protein [Clostridiales bacterium]
MQDKIIEINGSTGLDWAVQGMAILLFLVQLVLVVGLGILICKGIQTLNLYIKKNKE